MTALFSKLFLDHPRSVGESYFEHQTFALGFSLRLLGAGIAALIHAVLPFAFVTTASQMVRAMAAELEMRRRARV